MFKKSYPPEVKEMRLRVAQELENECRMAVRDQAGVLGYVLRLKKEISAPNQ